MPLPNPGMDAIPFTPLTAAFLDDMIENIEFLDDIVDGVSPVGPDGWSLLSVVNPTVVCNGNRSYTMTFASTNLTTLVTPGARIRTTRTVTAPTKSTSLNGTTQYYSKSSPNKMTFTDNFTTMGWVKSSVYQQGVVVARADAALNNGYRFGVLADGRIELVGVNAANANNRVFTTYQAVPLNKWTHIAMTWASGVGTAYIDGVSVPFATATNGTAPTTITQGTGDLAIGRNPGVSSLFFSGKLAQVAVFDAVLSAATIRSYMSQGLAGNETNLKSGYSFNNSIADLNTTTPNDLTANASAVATNADSPFGLQADGTTAGTTDYAIITQTAFSTNTTLTVQVPEGNTIPTSGGISSVSYSNVKAPYNMPIQRGKWILEAIIRINGFQATPVNGTWYNLGAASGITGAHVLNIPLGEWLYGYMAVPGADKGAAVLLDLFITLSTAINTESDPDMTSWSQMQSPSGTIEMRPSVHRTKALSLSAAAPYYLNVKSGQTAANIYMSGGTATTRIFAELAYL